MLTKAQAEARRKLKPSTKAVLDCLLDSGPYGATTHELMSVGYIDHRGRHVRGCSRFSARLGELRKVGYKIRAEYNLPGSYVYYLEGR